jgi:hypothetical protein
MWQQSERARAAQRCSGKRGPREGHVSCVCPYVSVKVVSWTGEHPGVHVAQRGAPAHPGYVATHARWAALRRGLDGARSAVSARPVGQAA